MNNKESIASYQKQLSDLGITKKIQSQCFTTFKHKAKDHVKIAWLATEVYAALENNACRHVSEDQWLDRFCEALKNNLRGNI